MKQYGAWIGFIGLLAFIIGQSAAIAIGKDDVQINKNEVFAIVQKGYEAQYSVRGKHMTVENMYDRLSPYFTDSFLQVFTDENSSSEKGSGTYLLSKEPPFSFTDETKLIYDRETGVLYIYEKIKETGIYEVMMMQRGGETWKIAGYHTANKLLEEVVQLEKNN